jgi:7-cyano-7-deazaguanine synthase
MDVELPMNLLLFSGGIDSSALAAWKRPDIALTIDYGQRPAKGEVTAATAIASELGIKHDVLRVDLSNLGVGPLAGKAPSEIASAPEWWPYRNQMLITLAGMRYVPRGLKQIIFGAVATDVHKDGKRPFLKSINALMRGQEGRVRVSAPAISIAPENLLRRSKFPRELIGLTFSCHVMEYACGKCRGCQKHARVLSRFRN